MAKEKTYWDILKNQPRFFTGWPGGYEVHIYEVEKLIPVRKKDANGRMAVEHGEYIRKKVMELENYKMPTETKKDIKRQIARQRRLASAVPNKVEYDNLRARIDEADWKMIEEKDLKGPALVHWAYNTHTADEFYRLLRYSDHNSGVEEVALKLWEWLRKNYESPARKS